MKPKKISNIHPHTRLVRPWVDFDDKNKKGTLDRINKTSTSRFFFFLIEKRQGLVVLIYNPFILGTSAIVIIQISITLKR